MNVETLKKLIADQVDSSLEAAMNKSGQESAIVKALLSGEGVPKAEEVRPKGQLAARIVRALAAGKGDVERAAHWATSKWGDEGVAKSLITGAADQGGFLVPEEASKEIIDLLRPRVAVRALNPIIVPMSSGVLTMPALRTGAAAEYIGEATPQNATGQTFGQLRLVWRKLRAHVPISNELLAFSNPAVDGIVQRDMVSAIAVREDQAFLRDDGTGAKPKGLRYWAAAGNIFASAGTTSAQVEADLRDAIEVMEGANKFLVQPGWMMSTRSKNFLANLREGTSGQLVFPTMRDKSPSLHGYPVAVSNNIPNNLGGGSNESEVYLADFADVIIGESSQLQIEVSSEATYTDGTGTLVSAFDRDETVIKVIERHDIAVRHEESVVVITAITWGV